MDKVKQNIIQQQQLDKFNIEKSVVGTEAYYINQDIQKGVSQDEIIEKARSGVYKLTAENKKAGRVGQKYGESKKVSEENKEGNPYKKFGDTSNNNGSGDFFLLKNKKTNKYAIVWAQENYEAINEASKYPNIEIEHPKGQEGRKLFDKLTVDKNNLGSFPKKFKEPKSFLSKLENYNE